MKKSGLLVMLGTIFCLLSGCAVSMVQDLKSDTMKGGPAIVCDDRKSMIITFAHPTTTAWVFDTNNSVIKHEKSGILTLIWEQNQHQKATKGLGFYVHRADGKPFGPGHYVFKMLLDKEGVRYIFEGEFNLQYGRALPIVIN